ncbi:hypothetical protein [Streptomyces sp. NPDC052114]|uniref:hypothetical protein n=1 Tax=unclassified Streptomyces TaxID=2593676 RepID=UPI00341799DF
MRIPRVGALGSLGALGVACAVVVAPGGGGGVAGAAPVTSEADVSFHGDVSLYAGKVKVRFVPRNHGPADLADVTVRLRWSVPLMDVRGLPDGCLRSEPGAVLCRVGALEADSVGEPVEVSVRVAGRPGEVGVRIATAWNGGAVDRNQRNNDIAVLALDTGDAYYF